MVCRYTLFATNARQLARVGTVQSAEHEHDIDAAAQSPGSLQAAIDFFAERIDDLDFPERATSDLRPPQAVSTVNALPSTKNLLPSLKSSIFTKGPNFCIIQTDMPVARILSGPPT